MALKAHHTHCGLASPLNKATQRTGRPRGNMNIGQPGSPSARPNRQGSGANGSIRIISCRWPAITTQVKEQLPNGGKGRMSAPPTNKGEGNRPIIITHSCPRYFTKKHAKGVYMYNVTGIPLDKNIQEDLIGN